MPFNVAKPMHKISNKLLLSISIWLICALSFMGMTLNLSWELEEGGVAINDAGSLRMRVYHLSTLVILNFHETESKLQHTILIEKNNFESTLNTLSQIGLRRWVSSAPTALYAQLDKVNIMWQQKVNKLLFHSDLRIDDPHVWLEEIDTFVLEINKLVKLIEIENTQNIKLLRFFQFLLIGMVIFSAYTARYLLNRLIILPLSILDTAIGKISQGQLDTRIQIVSQDEFGTVSLGFNQMASSLEDLYKNLDIKVKAQTLALENNNAELALLYEVTSFLHESPSQELMAQGFLKYLLNLTGAHGGSVRLLDEKRGKLDYISIINLSNELVFNEQCTSATSCYCGESIAQHSATIYQINKFKGDDLIKNEPICLQSKYKQFIVFNVKNNQRNIGLLTLYFNDCRVIDASNIRLIEILSNQLGVSIENQRLALQEQQFAVMSERNFMAQGLHDSIAQSLSFLNLQVQMLECALKDQDIVSANDNLKFIREGIQESYEDVRELLLNFRIRINTEAFLDAVRSVVTRFKQQLKIEVALKITGEGKELEPQQQLQVVFILQEVLSNVRKHSQATAVNIEIINDKDFILAIQDNGIGFDLEIIQAKHDRHVGMIIMHERASRINAKIDFFSVVNQGTRIKLVLSEAQRKM